MLNTLMYVRAYPEFHHEVISFCDVDVHQGILRDLQEAGATVSFVRQLTPDMVREMDPTVIFLKNTPVKYIQGDTGWLRKWPLVYSHHSFVRPVMACDTRIFNSRFLASQFGGMLEGMQSDIRYMGSLVDTSDLRVIKRSAKNARCVVGKVSSDHPDKFPKSLLGVFEEVVSQHCTKGIVVGAAKHWPEASSWLDMPKCGSEPVEDFYENMDIFVYRTAPSMRETWCRVITEAMAAGLAIVAENKGAIPEQIDHGVNGFLCDTSEEFVQHIRTLALSPQLRYDIGMAAREKAVEQFDISMLRQKTSDIVMRSAIGVM